MRFNPHLRPLYAAAEPVEFAWLAYLMSTERESCHSNVYVCLALAPLWDRLEYQCALPSRGIFQMYLR